MKAGDCLYYQLRPTSIKRNKKGKFRRTRWRELKYQTRHLNRQVIGGAIIVGILLGIGIDIAKRSSVVEYVNAAEPVEKPEPQEVRLEVIYNWSKAKIEEEIRAAFPETPNTAVAIAKCESRNLTIDIQAEAMLWYGRERSFGLFQIHEPDHHKTAVRLGLEEYKTNPNHNIALARHLYESRGWKPWTCYTNGRYLNHL